jgi:hypothetical protein
MGCIDLSLLSVSSDSNKSMESLDCSHIHMLLISNFSQSGTYGAKAGLSAINWKVDLAKDGVLPVHLVSLNVSNTFHGAVQGKFPQSFTLAHLGLGSAKKPKASLSIFVNSLSSNKVIGM